MSRLSTAKMNSEQFLMLGEDPPGLKLELAHGEIVVSPSPSPKHQSIVTRLIGKLFQQVEEPGLGRLFTDTDTIFGPEDTRRPDLIYFTAERCHLVGEKALMGPPDLCVEVLSPSSINLDKGDKLNLYEDTGVPYYWIVDPKAKTIEAYVLTGGKYQLQMTWRGEEKVNLPPFGDLGISFRGLWPPA